VHRQHAKIQRDRTLALGCGPWAPREGRWLLVHGWWSMPSPIPRWKPNLRGGDWKPEWQSAAHGSLFR
jgi:hypothetical protein